MTPDQTPDRPVTILCLPVKLFDLGTVYATPGALRALERAEQTPSDFLSRHLRGDWGDVDRDDWEANQASLKDGSRLLSAYYTSAGDRLWVITEAEDDGGVRASSTLLVPEEY